MCFSARLRGGGDDDGEAVVQEQVGWGNVIVGLEWTEQVRTWSTASL